MLAVSWWAMNDREDPGWSRSEWARWWLNHDEVDEAARVLEPGDVLPVGKADFLDLAAALLRRGLTARYEDGAAFVYTPSQAQQLGDETNVGSGALDTSAGGPAVTSPGARKPPARSAAPEAPRAKRTA
jgi:hypothetical protein